MVDHILLKSLGVSDKDIDAELNRAFGGDFSLDKLTGVTGPGAPPAQRRRAAAPSAPVEGIEQPPEGVEAPEDSGPILKARVVAITNNEAVVDVGLKSEGVIPLNEWDDPKSVKVGDSVDVFVEEDEADGGMILLSKRRADRILNWRRLMETTNENDTVKGRVLKKIKGGLLVDIGVPVFLPASQVDIRRPADIGEYVDRTIEAKVLKIDKERRNIVISRRKLIEEQRAMAKERLLAEIQEGQIRKGVVKNIADFGAFVDLGGIDGLLHITDMSWDRVDHPSQLVKIDQEIEVKILNVDRDKEKIALGLKQKEQNPWERVAERYPVGMRVRGEVVNIMNYGAFVKLEPGVEGLVHISEMSWTRRINHPSEVVNPGDQVDVVVLEINKDKQEISLGMKQTEVNPWTTVAEKYPPNTVVEGVVRNLTNYGAFVEIEEGIDGLLHISDMSWTKKVSHPSEMLKKGDRVRCVVLVVDQEKQRIALGLKQMTEDPWIHAVPERYQPGMVVRGKVTKITNFGVFVELEQDLEGLLHVSELSDDKVENPQDVVKIGDEVDVKILRVDVADRKIGLSKKRADWAGGDSDGEGGATPSKPKQRRGGTDQPHEGLGSLTFRPDESR
jgi:small subunit ribosomal protein S1